MPLDHTSLLVPAADFEAVISFLVSALGHTGFREHMRPHPTVVGMGETMPYFWIAAINDTSIDSKAIEGLLRQTHIAFKADSVQQVRQFHAAALKAGGTDNGKPGRRPLYHPGYYGAFVRDPACGVNFEVVFHGCPADEEGLKKMEEEADA